MSQNILLVTGLEGTFSREKLRVPGPNVTMKALLESFCKDHNLGDPSGYYFVSTTGSKKPFNMTIPFRLLNLKSYTEIGIRAFPKKTSVDAQKEAAEKEEREKKIKEAMEAAPAIESLITYGQGSEAGREKFAADERRRAEEIQRELEIERRALEKEQQLLVDWGMDDKSAEKLAMETSQPLVANRTQVEMAQKQMQEEDQEAMKKRKTEPEEPLEFHIEKIRAYSVANPVPSKAESKEELPDEFFEMTAEDLRALKEASDAKKKAESGFKTREMREAEKMRRYERFSESSIRFRFHDRVEVFYTFPTTSRIKVLYEFLEFCLVTPHPQFELYITPPVMVLKNKDELFINCHLVPAAIVNVRWIGDSEPKRTAEVLRSELSSTLAAVESLPQEVCSSSKGHVLGSSKNSAASSKPTGPVCSSCFKGEGVTLKHCRECNENFCSECWSKVHSQREDMEEHHVETTYPQQKPASKDSSNTSGGAKHMPKWFNPKKL